MFSNFFLYKIGNAAVDNTSGAESHFCVTFMMRMIEQWQSREREREHGSLNPFYPACKKRFFHNLYKISSLFFIFKTKA